MRLHPRTIAEGIERAGILDAAGKPLAGVLRRLIPRGPVKDALTGSWLGHPLHPVLTDVVIGAWLSAGFLDLFGGRRSQAAADRLVALGILAAVPTAASGVSDWVDVEGVDRRVGLVHGAGNVAALALMMLSYGSRRRGHRAKGITLSIAAMGMATGTAYLGGHLSFSLGVGVSRTAFDRGPARWVRVAERDQMAEGTMVRAEARGVPVFLVRDGEQIAALVDRCTHRGCRLSSGELNLMDGTVVCQCHGSEFRLSDGSVVHGPATSSQPSLDVRVQGGHIEVRRR